MEQCDSRAVTGMRVCVEEKSVRFNSSSPKQAHSHVASHIMSHSVAIVDALRLVRTVRATTRAVSHDTPLTGSRDSMLCDSDTTLDSVSP